MIAVLFKRLCFYGFIIIFYCGVFIEFINAAQRMFKIFDSAAVDSSGDEDEMDYLSKSFSDEADWLFSGETTNCKTLSLYYIVGLN